MAQWANNYRVVTSCVMIALLASLAGCGSDPLPPSPTPVSVSTSLPAPTVTFSETDGGTPFPALRLERLRSNGLVGARLGDLDAPFRGVVDRVYCTPAWRETTFPATLSLPVEQLRGDLLLEWNNSGTHNYVTPAGNPTYGLPASYTIATSADSTDGRDGTWLQVVNVTGNTARTRAHLVPSAGSRWVRMTVESAVPGPLGNTLAIDQIDLHDASNGTDDTVFFMGDSITASTFTRCPDNQPSFAELVHQADSERYPAMINGGVDAVNSGYGVSVIEDWLALNPDFHIWAIGYGTNDAWQKTSPALFERQLQTIVDRITEDDRLPVIARIPFAIKGPDDDNVRALNAVIDRIAARNGLLPGPDLYAWFREHRNELAGDGVHPTDAGARSINRLWYEALRPLYGSSP